MLNRSLWSLGMEATMKLVFFVRAMYRQLQQLYKEQSDANQRKFVVYRGQGLPQQHFMNLYDTKGSVLSFKSFLSTSREKNIAMAFVERTICINSDSLGVIFIMTIDPNATLASSTPFVLMD
ncbi:unnamed protein product [Rotaria socialis]|uniref:Uncharacterized protein n=1 Tax=Rotaria socialis TaxID=392032 RepID=A0A817SBU1_9BILA|nr:unnamed protein product [Rotaria socialis]CAF4397231.1 unnamed protein product [Rotaria socialis]